MRRRARHRLIGAVVLVLLAVVGFPLMFDTQPRPVAVDTPILIPDRPTTAPLKVTQTPPADTHPAKPLLPDAKPLPVQEGLKVVAVGAFHVGFDLYLNPTQLVRNCLPASVF